MFNPKGSTLLDEQLAVSGLELNILGFIGNTIGANKANKQAKRNYKRARKAAKKVAKLTNKQNDRLDKADRQNYYRNRKFSHDSNLKTWRTGRQIHNFKTTQALREFEKSRDIFGEQKQLNKLGFKQGVAAEKQSLEDEFLKQQFDSETALSSLKQTYAEQSLNKKEQYVQLQGIRSQRNLGTAAIQNNVDQLMTQGSLAKESAMVEGLMAEGESSLGQAGKSRQKAKQSSRANIQRSIISLSSELTGKRQAAGIELAQLNAESSLAETGVGLNLQKINNTIANAEEEADYNSRVSSANMDSFLAQSKLNLEDLALKKHYADVNAKASKMLKPRKLPYASKPEMPPERILVRRMRARPSHIPAPIQQSVFAAAMSGISSDISLFSGLNFSQGGGNDTPSPESKPVDLGWWLND
tara:strand:+ start:3026 stop:4264 length:1239 start_codon:yes stop_codon:yes gene_type:complete